MDATNDRCPGRTREFRSLLSRLQSGLTATPGSAVVVGAPGFGKTTFLEHWADAEVRKSVMGAKWDAIRFVHVRVTDDESLTEDRLLGMLRDALQNEARPVTETTDGTESLLEDLVIQTIGKENRALVFLIDDFHLVSQSPRFGAPFFSFLRHLGYSRRAGYVLSSRLDVGEMALKQDVQASPFWNIFSKIRMAGLGQQTAPLLKERLAKLKGLSDAHYEVLQALCGGIPFLLQLTINQAQVAAREGKDWSTKALLERIAAAGKDRLDAVWPASRPEWHDAIRLVLVRRGDVAADVRDVLLPLVQNGCLDGESVRPVSLVLEWDWLGRVRADRGPLEAGLPVLPPLAGGGLWSKLFSR